MSNELPKVETPITPSAFLSDASPVSSRFWVAPSRAFFWQRFTSSLPVAYPVHTHPEYNAVVCLRGCVEVRQKGTTQVAEAGEALIGNAGIPHQSTYFPDGERCEAVSLTVSAEFLQEAVTDLYGRNIEGHQRPVFLGKISSRKVQSIAALAYDELLSGRPCDSGYMNHLAHALIGSSLRSLSCRQYLQEPRTATEKALLPRWQYVKTHELMLRSSKHEFSIPTIARELGISPGRFHSLFRSATGSTPAHYFATLLLAKASKTLLESDHSVKRISYDLGFRSPSHFCSLFKRYFGVSPLDYRNLAHEGKSREKQQIDSYSFLGVLSNGKIAAQPVNCELGSLDQFEEELTATG
jgi:AraC family transcriptional regulator